MSKSDPEKLDPRRGRHKKRASAETHDWNRAYLPPKPVPRPAWMDAETEAKLRALRREVDLWGWLTVAERAALTEGEEAPAP
jgi:hypothetical protein